VDAAVENQHRLVKPGRRYEHVGGDLGESAPTVNGTEYEWRRLRWKVGQSGFLGRVFVCFLVSLSFLVPFLLLVSFGMCRLLSELDLHVTNMGFWGCGDDG